MVSGCICTFVCLDLPVSGGRFAALCVCLYVCVCVCVYLCVCVCVLVCLSSQWRCQVFNKAKMLSFIINSNGVNTQRALKFHSMTLRGRGWLHQRITPYPPFNEEQGSPAWTRPAISVCVCVRVFVQGKKNTSLQHHIARRYVCMTQNAL